MRRAPDSNRIQRLAGQSGCQPPEGTCLHHPPAGDANGEDCLQKTQHLIDTVNCHFRDNSGGSGLAGRPQRGLDCRGELLRLRPFRVLIVTRIARSLCRRKGARGDTAQPWASSDWTTGASSGTGIQTAMPAVAWTSIPRSASAATKRSRRSHRSSAARSSRGDALVGPQPATGCWSRWLTHCGPTAWRPRTRLIVCGVAGEHREAQVGAERLGQRDGRRPSARGRRSGSAAARRRSAEVVVLEHHRRRGAVEDARSSAARSGSSEAPVGFWPRGLSTTAAAPSVERLGELAGEHAPARRSAPVAGPGPAPAGDRRGRRSRGLRRRPGRPAGAAPASARSIPSRAPLMTAIVLGPDAARASSACASSSSSGRRLAAVELAWAGRCGAERASGRGAAPGPGCRWPGRARPPGRRPRRAPPKVGASSPASGCARG